MKPNPNPNFGAMAAVVVCGLLSTYSWYAWPLMAALLWLLTGRDPLWLAAGALDRVRGFCISLFLGGQAFVRVARRTFYATQKVAREQSPRLERNTA